MFVQTSGLGLNLTVLNTVLNRGWAVLASVQPYVLIAAWITLGISIGFVVAHTLFNVARGVRVVWPVAFLFAVSGWMAAGLPGLLAGLGCAALIGIFVAGV